MNLNQRSFDLIIRGGRVFDGTGAEGILADVGISGNRISAIGDLSEAQSGSTVDATGKSVAPGFIDIHTHSDVSLCYDPGQASYLTQGVTTQVVGNCGLAVGMTLDTPAFEFEKKFLGNNGAEITWNTLTEFLDQADDRGLGTNIATLAAHGTVRKLVMDMADRKPDASELRRMQAILEDALNRGAWGFSSGLEYPPSMFADVEELAALCSVMKGHGGFYATHLRNEADTLFEAMDEALQVATRAGVPLQFSHHKAEGVSNWGKTVKSLQMIEAARAHGLDVHHSLFLRPSF